MIIPADARLRLDPRDDALHAPEQAPNYNESVYLDFFDANRKLGAWLRIGNRPNEGHAETSICLYLPDGRIAFWFARPAIQNNAEMAAGGLRVEVVRPFEQLRLSYQGFLLLLDDPTAIHDPGHAFKTAPRVQSSMTLDVTGLSPMSGGEIVRADGSPYPLDPDRSPYRGHLEQHVSVRGSLMLDGVEHALDGLGYRDKSWGARHWQSLHWHKWMPVTFSRDFGLMAIIMGQPGQAASLAGHIFRQGKLHDISAASVDVDYDSSNQPRHIVASLRTDAGRYDLTGKAIATIPLRSRRTQPDGTETTVRIVKAMTQFSCDGHTALGMVEFLDVMAGDRPISLVEGVRNWNLACPERPLPNLMPTAEPSE